MISPVHITYSPTYPSVETGDIIANDNASDNTVEGSYYSAHQAVGKFFAEHHIDMVSCIRRKCQTRAGVSGDINKTLECVTIADSKLSNRVLE